MAPKCYENKQYLKKECLDKSELPGSFNDNRLEETLLKYFSKVNVPVEHSNVPYSHHLIVKLSKWKDVYWVFCAKPSFKSGNLTGTDPYPTYPKVCAGITSFYGQNARKFG